MPASGRLVESRTYVANALTALGMVPVIDPRNARPLTVFVGIPEFTAYTNKVTDITVLVQILAGPPGNLDAADYLLTQAETIINSGLYAISGEPSIWQVGTQELPAYDLTLRIGSLT